MATSQLGGGAVASSLGPVANSNNVVVRPERPMRIVCMGGGTGLPTVLRGLSRLSARIGGPGIALTAIVAVSDDGGSSGRLREQVGILPPGDIRNCLVAMGDGRSPLARVFQHRFGRGSGDLEGHAVGNLVLAALAERDGDFLQAVRVSAKMLGVRGRVLPSTLREVRLIAALDDGRVVRGERDLVRARGRVARLGLEPARPPPTPGLLGAIGAADLVVLGPGSLYSSTITNLLVDGVAPALEASGALKVFVGNLMTEPGETDAMDGVAHLQALLRHAGRVVDCVLVNSARAAPELLERYAGRRSRPVHYDRDALLSLGVVPIERDVLKIEGARIRHDARKLAALLVELALAARRDSPQPRM